ncbi:phospho-sugar mutase [Porphyromonas cangingivalis]|uniref:Phosphoglucomutase n=1 Tax=Porphyromonas cangingivalis TaxID=36874 RepID=A0A1T4NJP4_PORCN|nr:phospho-sugar mutase [Porphyromonas cangingivalis]SJZ79276.1 phosphoglucomutase [Porphyromonas cangingivalis]SPY35171.1 Phosphoglucomutase [Porphyromonas cangingivalis]VEJ03565.1 Phosphoglucomutase [Porphyromonas cangingivalis]
MSQEELLKTVMAKAELWLGSEYDQETQAEVRTMMESDDKTPLIEAFYKDLEFGTGGLRGIMGAGTNRMNKYTVGAATQGLSNYIIKECGREADLKVVIGHDCRNNSRKFAEIAAGIFAANGIKVFLFEDLRPTPEISYAIRELGCQSGIMITASHNPKIYNGYKAYWSDGAQMIAPHDRNVISEVNQIRSVSDIKFDGPKEMITLLGAEMDKKFIDAVVGSMLSPDSVKRHHDIKIVYTPIHGTGVKIVPPALKAAGFTNIYNVPEQDVISGNFPTVESPNPEEPAALKMAIERAKEVDAELVMASDPDGDRIGAAVKDNNGEWILVNGNQTCLLYAYYAIEKRREEGKLDGNQYLVKTIVTTDLIRNIAERNNVELYDCYTGFKWIADVIRKNEGKKEYLGGGEESYGYLWEDFIRDKSSVSACVILAEIAAWAKDKGLSIYQLLDKIYCDYGYSLEKGISVVRPGKSGAEEIEAMMKNFRHNPPKALAGSIITEILDYSNLKGQWIDKGEVFTLDMPTTSNVLQYKANDGTKLSIRPSGTEPKIKFYIQAQAPVASPADLESARKKCEEKIGQICQELGL